LEAQRNTFPILLGALCVYAVGYRVVGVVIVLFEVARRCWLTLHGVPIPIEAFGPPAKTAGLPVSGSSC